MFLSEPHALKESEGDVAVSTDGGENDLGCKMFILDDAEHFFDEA